MAPTTGRNKNIDDIFGNFLEVSIERKTKQIQNYQDNNIPSKLDKIKSLRRTINYLSNQSQLAIEMIDSDPGMVKLILKEMFNQNQYTYR